jgi:hypothetical protein
VSFLDGKRHIFECANGHRWECGDESHHSDPDRYLCAHRCGAQCVSVRCPVGCALFRAPDGITRRKAEPVNKKGMSDHG